MLAQRCSRHAAYNKWVTETNNMQIETQGGGVLHRSTMRNDARADAGGVSRATIEIVVSQSAVSIEPACLVYPVTAGSACVCGEYTRNRRRGEQKTRCFFGDTVARAGRCCTPLVAYKSAVVKSARDLTMKPPARDDKEEACLREGLSL